MAISVLRRSFTAAPLPPPPSLLFQSLRSHQTVAAHRRHPQPPPHEHSNPTNYLGSWKSPPPTSDPREAEVRLHRLRRDYAKQVKQLRREYAYEMDLQRAEQERKADVQREAARLANEERKAAKAAAAKVAAAERKAFEENFRQMMMKERAQKLEYWKEREYKLEQKKIKEKELLRRQTSVWVSEENLENRIRDEIVDTKSL